MKTTIVHPITVREDMLAVPPDKFKFWERRMHIDDIFHEIALPWNSEVNVVEMYYEIIAYCKANHKMPLNVAWGVSDGVLYADGKSVKRVGPKENRYYCSNEAEADYWEDRCLSMGEPVD